MKMLLAYTVLMLTSVNLFAQDCKNAVTQTDMNNCANIAFKASDKNLNEAYRKLMDSKDINFKNLLKESQRSWIKFRDNDCKVQSYPTRGGSAQAMVRLDCLKEKTDQRYNELNSMLTCEEGDLTCQPKS